MSSFHIIAGDNIINTFTDPQLLVKAYPGFKAEFDAMLERKKAYEDAKSTGGDRDLVGMVPKGAVMIRAQVPWPVLAAIKNIDPFFLRDKKRFNRWLDRHPIYRIGRYINRRSLGCRLA